MSCAESATNPMTTPEPRAPRSGYAQFVIFGAIGVVNTLVHAAVVILLVERLEALQFVANIAGFLLSNLVSYIANSRLTFRKPLRVGAYLRFLSASLTTLGLVAAVSLAGDVFGFYYLYTLAFLVIASPIVSFLMMKYFAFR